MPRQRRGRHEGAIFFDESKNLWIGEVSSGFHPDGRRRRYKVSSKTKTGCQTELRILQRKLENGELVDGGRFRGTVVEYTRAWVEGREGSIRTKTLESYRSTFRRHIEPHLKALKLNQARPDHLRAYFQSLDKAGVGRPTQRLIYQVLNSAFEQATIDELIPKNPLAHIKRPKQDPTKKRPKPVWSADELKRFLEEARHDRHFPFFMLMFTTGARMSELLGARPEDFKLNTDPSKWQISRGLHEVKGGISVEPPKSATSRRLLQLPATTAQVLREHLRRREEEGVESEWMFCSQQGTPLSRHNLRKRHFQVIVERAGVTPIPMKQARHSVLTLMAEAGVSQKATQALAGHADGTLLLEVHQQVTDELRAQPARVMDAIVAPVAGKLLPAQPEPIIEDAVVEEPKDADVEPKDLVGAPAGRPFVRPLKAARKRKTRRGRPRPVLKVRGSKRMAPLAAPPRQFAPADKKKPPPEGGGFKDKTSGAPGTIRTCDLLIRSQMLYPAELRAHAGVFCPTRGQVVNALLGPKRRLQPRAHSSVGSVAP
jgi:integrase